MKEMRLFEVGLKEGTRGHGYEEKVNVAADTAEEAITKVHQWVVDNTQQWWDGDGREAMIFDAYTEDKKAPEDMKDTEILSSPKYQALAQKDFDSELERVKGLRLAKLLDIGTLIV